MAPGADLTARVAPTAGLTVLASDAVRRALDLLESTDAETLADQVALTEIPAPTGDEGARARWVRDRFASLGLADVGTDEVGNVVGRWPGAGADPASNGARAGAVALVAHLDTVFPAGTDVRVRRDGARWLAPGIGDNARGLAGLLAVARAVTRVPVRPCADLLLVASVGEEGLGNLRGVRHLFEASPLGARIARFIALDGCDARRIVRRAVGSRRYRITLRGPGGHSWGTSGVPSAVNALGGLVARLAALPLPTDPRTTLNVGMVGGGSAVNAVAAEAWCLVEVRSIGEAALARLETAIREAADEATAAERRRAAGARPGGRTDGAEGADLTALVATIGLRPGGETPPDDPLVRAARAATRALGFVPAEPDSSTDANVPMARAVPAITIGAGGLSGGAHTPEEWYENEDGVAGVQRVLLTALEVAGVADG